MWNSANNERTYSHNKDKWCKRNCSHFFFFFLMLLGPIFAYTGAAIAATLALACLPCTTIFWQYNIIRCKKAAKVALCFIPAMIAIVCIIVFGGAFSSVGLCIYYVVLVLFFMLLVCRSCCSCRQLCKHSEDP